MGLLMKRWIWGVSAVLLLSLTTGCTYKGMQKMTKEEVNKINMKTFKEGSLRQRMQGTTLNTALLQTLKAECSKRGIRLTHETYAEGLDGNISYSYFINGDARHFLIVNVFPNEEERIRKMAAVYGTGDGQGINIYSKAGEANVISTKNNTALVYSSSGVKQSKYSKEIKEVFKSVLSNVSNHIAP
ncbi:hypothetical protein SAMN04488542_101271 [Fontibacillus panacisegetis]|uniref:Uncharacterized protein n=2 Tax=Fontibacillus panacisegetis TaxID=670482 RepID=A0A1G7EMP0_9BACL|nr:hypothetical protein SAMN04488542_101271 [Fontibacillus panacisegetis]